MSPPSVPPQAPSSGRPLPSAGSLGAGSPTSQVLSADSDFSPPSRVTSSPSLRATTASPSSLPRSRTFPPRAWTTSIAAPAPPLHGGDDETSQVPGRPLRTCPALRPRRTSGPRPLQDRRWGLPPFQQRRLRIGAFGAPSRGLHALCVRFAAGVAPGPRNTRFRLVASLGRSGLSPAGSRRRFPACLSLYIAFPLHQALPGAMKSPCIGCERGRECSGRFAGHPDTT